MFQGVTILICVEILSTLSKVDKLIEKQKELDEIYGVVQTQVLISLKVYFTLVFIFWSIYRCERQYIKAMIKNMETKKEFNEMLDNIELGIVMKKSDEV